MAGSLGESFARALAVKDFDQIASLLHPDVDFRGMTPGSLPGCGCCALAINPSRPLAAPRDASDRLRKLGHRALPARHLLHGMFQSATPRVQELGFLGEPTTVTTSPGRTSL